ncbi:cysteine desulfurase [Fibrobacterales bacterium]|nr:cysteine desulfurase [Fibrobacterales bacterium]
MLNPRSQFPVLSQAGHSLAFLDSAATAQKPLPVIEAMNDFYKNHYSSVKRGAYSLSAKTTALYEQARAKVAAFIGANPDEIIFTKGTTESINLVANSYGFANFKNGDEIVLSALEHHANIVPWQLVQNTLRRFNINIHIKVLDCDNDGNLVFADNHSPSLRAECGNPDIFNSKTKIVSLTHTSNAIGTINPLNEIIPIIRNLAPQAQILIDGAQGVPHSHISVANYDFLAFSGHKLYAPTGIGVLYGKRELLEKMPPYQGGGEMIDKVTFEETTFAAPPARFEAGTPPIAEVIGLGAAIDFINEIGMENITKHEEQITAYTLDELKKIPEVQIIGNPKNRGSIISFLAANIHPHDAAL